MIAHCGSADFQGKTKPLRTGNRQPGPRVRAGRGSGLMIEKIVKRDGRLVPFDREKIVFAIFRAAVAVGGRDRETAERVADDVVAMLEKRSNAASQATVEEVQDIVEKCLIERGHARTAKAYIVYRYEHTLKRKGRDSLTYSSENIPYQKLWEALSWAVDNHCATTADLSAQFAGIGPGRLIDAAEEFYRTEIDSAFAKIEERLDDIRLLIVSGPSASGKTTTTLKIKEKLAAHGRAVVPLAVDNYFFNLEDHPRDSHGDYDFETPQAIDLALVNRHLRELLEGKTVDVPFYDFKKGKRNGSSGMMTLEKNGIILVDSLHGLYEEMTEGIGEERKFKLYIETLSQLKDARGQYVRWSDIRLMRRMVRDLQFRNYDPRHTILHWHHVRRAELRHIVSRLMKAHAVVNSSLAFELPFLKARLAEAFARFAAEFRDNPEFEDAAGRAVRVCALFSEIPACADEALVPTTSLLREFIGGSTYIY
jgi:uridine kinase